MKFKQMTYTAPDMLESTNQSTLQPGETIWGVSPGRGATHARHRVTFNNNSTTNLSSILTV